MYRASRQPIPHTEERGDTCGDQSGGGTIAKPNLDGNSKKAEKVEEDVTPKTVMAVPMDRERQ